MPAADGPIGRDPYWEAEEESPIRAWIARRTAVAATRARWTAREQVTTAEAAELCDIAESTVRGYISWPISRPSFPSFPDPWWARNRDTRGNLYDAEQVGHGDHRALLNTRAQLRRAGVNL